MGRRTVYLIALPGISSCSVHASDSSGVAKKAAKALHDTGIPAKGEVATGDPAHCIIERSRELHAPLVVIGRRGLTGFRELIMGSVRNKVVHYADCPVLVTN